MAFLYEYLFELIAFGITTLLRKRREMHSNTWPTVKGTVAAVLPDSNPTCLTAQIIYRYLYGGRAYSGSHEKTFFWKSSLLKYEELFQQGGEIVVRVQPKDHTVSVIRDDDQSF